MKPYYSNVRNEMLRFIPHDASRILEIGCAAGNFGASIKARNNAEVWGIELDPAAGQIAAKQLDNVLIGSVPSVLGALPEKHFDCVVCNDVLEHIADPASVLDALRRVMLPNALIVGSIPNIRYFPVLLDLVWNAEWRYVDSGVLDRTHLRFFTGKSLKRFLQDAGYTPLTIEGINPTPSIRARLLRLVTLGKFRDCQFLQYAFVARPHPVNS